MRRLLPRNAVQELAAAAGIFGLVGGIAATWSAEAQFTGGGVALGMWLSSFYLDLRGA